MTSFPKETGINSVPSERGDVLDFQSIGINTDHEFLHTPSLSFQVCDKDAPVQQTLILCSGQNQLQCRQFLHSRLPEQSGRKRSLAVQNEESTARDTAPAKRLPEGKVQK